jgi:hypothetical protein
VTLKRVSRGGGRACVVLTACPFCGEEFDSTTDRPSHFEESHSPSDAGLSPKEDSPAEANESLFAGMVATDGGER